MSIPVGVVASGLDIFLKYQNVLTNPLALSYVIYEPGSTPVASGSGFQLSTGHYDARDSVVPSGYSVSSSWTITWTFTSPANVTSSASETFVVVSGLVSSFDNTKNITSIIEQVKLDLGLTTEFTDAELRTFLVKSINRLNRRLELTGTAGEMSYDSETQQISPSPNATMQDFLVMQMECLLIKRDRRVAIGKGIRVKDGETEIDTTASFGGWNNAVEDICGELEKAVEDFLAEDDKAVYEAAYEEATNIWYGTQNICEQLFHNGQGDGRERCQVSPYESSANSLIVYM